MRIIENSGGAFRSPIYTPGGLDHNIGLFQRRGGEILAEQKTDRIRSTEKDNISCADPELLSKMAIVNWFLYH